MQGQNENVTGDRGACRPGHGKEQYCLALAVVSCPAAVVEGRNRIYIPPTIHAHFVQALQIKMDEERMPLGQPVFVSVNNIPFEARACPELQDDTVALDSMQSFSAGTRLGEFAHVLHLDILRLKFGEVFSLSVRFADSSCLSIPTLDDKFASYCAKILQGQPLTRTQRVLIVYGRWRLELTVDGISLGEDKVALEPLIVGPSSQLLFTFCKGDAKGRAQRPLSDSHCTPTAQPGSSHLDHIAPRSPVTGSTKCCVDPANHLSRKLTLHEMLMDACRQHEAMLLHLDEINLAAKSANDLSLTSGSPRSLNVCEHDDWADTENTPSGDALRAKQLAFAQEQARSRALEAQRIRQMARSFVKHSRMRSLREINTAPTDNPEAFTAGLRAVSGNAQPLGDCKSRGTAPANAAVNASASRMHGALNVVAMPKNADIASEGESRSRSRNAHTKMKVVREESQAGWLSRDTFPSSCSPSPSAGTSSATPSPPLRSPRSIHAVACMERGFTSSADGKWIAR
jgi:hypothetical protein